MSKFFLAAPLLIMGITSDVPSSGQGAKDRKASTIGARFKAAV